MKPVSALGAVVDAVEAAIDRFPHVWQPDATLAFSGGKDSIALASALVATGRSVRLRAVDMGYSRDWRGRLQRLADAIKVPIEFLVVADLVQSDLTAPDIKRDLAIRRAFLERDSAYDPTITPCTNCYNCKILSLVGAARKEVSTILFAHHATDALSSFLKSALMYIDRWDDGNSEFDRDRFRELGMRLAGDLRAGGHLQMLRLQDLLEQGKAHTSEPPVEHRALHDRSYTIGRPMFFLAEGATTALVKALGVTAESSGCGHSATAFTRTPREIVHYELLPLIAETPPGAAALRDLLEMLAMSLNDDGTAQANPRQARHVLLGASYKGGPENLADRL